MSTLEKIFLSESPIVTYNAWMKIYNERAHREQEIFSRWYRACNTHLWYIDRWFAETDENKKKELGIICDKVEAKKTMLWDKKQYWSLRADDAWHFAQEALKEMKKVW